jgi:hypothetical protein
MRSVREMYVVTKCLNRHIVAENWSSTTADAAVEQLRIGATPADRRVFLTQFAAIQGGSVLYCTVRLNDSMRGCLPRASCLPESFRRALVAAAREDSPVSDALHP